MPGAKSGDHLGEDRSQGQIVLGWFLLAWAVFLVWHYAAVVLKVRSVPELLGLMLLATVLVVGVPGALLARLERRRGRT
ncbi:MAG: hypothetical protein RDU83_09600 [bacterium]|nr:hypothetical protein [bacterium]